MSNHRAGACAGFAMVLAVMLVSSGCGSARTDNAQNTAQRFLTAVADTDTDAACALLLPDTREAMSGAGEVAGDCTQVLPRLTLKGTTVTNTQVWGDAGLAHTDGDTLFLRDSPQGWLVSAAGCRPAGDDGYECELRGR